MLSEELETEVSQKTRKNGYYSLQPTSIDRTKTCLQNKILKPHLRRNLRGYKYFTRFKHVTKPHYTEINNEEKLALYIRTHYGIGEFNILFKWVIPVKKMYFDNKRKTTFVDFKLNKKGHKVRRWATTKFSQIVIKDGFDPKTSYDFTYLFLPKVNKMYKFFWWKGKEKGYLQRKKREDIENTADTLSVLNTENFVEI